MKRGTGQPVPTYLEVILRIPVRVKDDAGISSSEINAQTSCPCAQEEHKPIGIRFGESVNGCLAEVASDSAINPLIWVPGNTTGGLTNSY